MSWCACEDILTDSCSGMNLAEKEKEKRHSAPEMSAGLQANAGCCLLISSSVLGICACSREMLSTPVNQPAALVESLQCG